MPTPPATSTADRRVPCARVAALRGALAAAVLVGGLDALRAVLRMREVPLEGLLEGAPRGLDGLVFGGAATVASWLVPLAPLVLLGALVGRRRPRLAAAVPLVVALGAFVFWVLRLRYQSGLPVASAQSLALAAGVCLAAMAVAVPLTRGLMAVRTGRLAGFVLVVALVGVSWMVIESRNTRATGVISERNRDVPNVLFVLVDALRADALAVHGNAIAKTPVIDELAARGTVFETALAQAPYTWTSFGSFFTGKYPRRHGLLKMAPGVSMPDNVTIASYLDSATRKDGVRLESDDVATGAFLTGALSQGSGLARGFDDICELMRGNALIRTADRWSQFRAWTALGAVWTKLWTRFEPNLQLDTARDWLVDHADRRFFAFVHLYSTHTPYDPPEEFRSLYVDPTYDGPIQSFWAEHRRAIERGEYVVNAADRRQINDLYMGGVSQADHDIGELLGALRRAGVLDDTLVIVTSDHGEDLGEGGRWEHNHMYRSNLHVPLVMSWPNGLPQGVRVAEHVESIDVFPTVIDALGLEQPQAVGSFEKIDGRSLLPLVRGETPSWRRYTFAEDSSLVSISDERDMLVLDRFAVKPDGWRVALLEGLGTVRFHDLVNDPLQRRDLFKDVVRDPQADPSVRSKILERVDALRAALLEWNADQPIDVEDVVRSERDLESESNLAQLAQDRELLSRLGYAPGWDQYQGVELRERVLELRAEQRAK